MIGTSPLAVSGHVTPTHEDTIAYRRWQHEDMAATIRREHQAQAHEVSASITVLITVASVFAAVLVAGCVMVLGTPGARAADSMSGVRVTTYKANASETDSDPSHTASGAVTAVGQIAVSRDLLWRSKKPFHFHWGDKLRIIAPGQRAECNAVYVVQDTMAARWRKRVDIVLPRTTPYFSCYNVTIEKVP